MKGLQKVVNTVPFETLKLSITSAHLLVCSEKAAVQVKFSTLTSVSHGHSGINTECVSVCEYITHVVGTRLPHGDKSKSSIMYFI